MLAYKLVTMHLFFVSIPESTLATTKCGEDPGSNDVVTKVGPIDSDAMTQQPKAYSNGL